MKRCPQCNRLETNDSLAFCRFDGTGLVNNSSATGGDAGTVRLDPGSPSAELATSLLSQKTSSQLDKPTDSTIAPPAKVNTTGKLKKRRNLPRMLIAAAVLIIVAGCAAAFFHFRKTSVPIDSIAVMPFINDSGNADVEYLSDGMTDSLITSLSQVPNLNVKARSSVFRYKGKDTNPKSLAQELNVQAILNGRFTQHGDQLSLTLELVNAQTENVIWSERYNRSQSDLLTLQSDIARDVSSKLSNKLTGADTQKLLKAYTSNPEAYRLYLQGRFYWNKREAKDLHTAIDYFNRAIELDVNYPLAYAGLADSYALLSSFNFMPPTEATPKARGFALKALSLDDTLAEPHTTLALTIFQFDYDFAGAEREYKRAIELNPNYATAHQWYGELLSCAGRFDEAGAELRRALELEPLSLPINWDYGRYLHNARRFDEALAQHKKTIDLDGGFARARRTLAEVYRLRKDYPAAIEEMARYFELRGQPDNATLTRETFAKSGWTGYLKLTVEENSPFLERNWIRAKAYVELGDKDRAFEELNTAYDLHESTLTWIKVDPLFDPLRSDPRYQELLRKMRIP